MTRFMSAGLLTLLSVACLLAQDDDLYLPYNRVPETTREFWAVVKYEINLGNYRRARDQLKNFWDRLTAEPDQEKLLISLYEKEGLAYFVKLSNIPELRELKAKDPETDKERPVVELLVQQVSRAVTLRFRDPERIRFFVRRLAGTTEERAYAIDQLRRAGPLAVPALVEMLRDPQLDAKSKEPFYSALFKLNREAGPPLLACLDSKDSRLQMMVLDWFLFSADERIVPYLWYLSASKEALPAVRDRARTALSRFTHTPVSELADARAMCLKEATRWYNHEVEFPPGGNPTVWIWNDTTGPTPKLLTPSQAEEYWAVFWARKALELDPTYEPAQVLLLSALMDKAHERGGVDQGLDKIAPEVHQLLSGSRSQLIEDILDKALAEQRSNVALAAARALQPVGEWRLVRNSAQGLPPLVRALSYPDRRVQMAAAEAILNIPTADGFAGASRVVEVLRRAITGDAAPRAVIGFSKEDAAREFADLVRQLGYEPSIALNGRQTVKLATELGDVEILFLDPKLAEVGGVNAVVAQLRGNADTAGIPIVLVAEPDQQNAMTALASRYPRVSVISPVPATVEMLKLNLETTQQSRQVIPLSEAERRAYAQRALEWLRRMASGEKSGYDVRPAQSTLIQALGNDELAPGAAAVLALLGGKANQQALADLVINGSRSEEVRAEAARSLRASMQRHGIFLKPEQLAGLVQLATTAENPALQVEAVRIANSLKPDPSADGSRLKSAPPPLPRQGQENENP
jgi:CheY-like chemotaxis protein